MKKENMKLGDYVEVMTGYSFRGRIESQEGGVVGILQMKDMIRNYTQFNYQNIDRSNDHDFKERFILQDRDILFVSKGTNNSAVLFREQDFPCVASAVFFVIRVTRKDIVPEFLVWYINQSRVQSYLVERRAGTSMVNINKQDVMDIPLQEVSYKKQKAIGDYTQLYQKEQELVASIQLYKEKFIQQQLINLIDHE